MSIVYIIYEDRKFDLKPAEEFGEVEFIFPSNPRLMDIPLLMKELDEKLYKVFNPKEDYILLMGSHTCIFALSAFLAMNYESINLLVYGAISKKYSVKMIEFGGIGSVQKK